MLNLRVVLFILVVVIGCGRTPKFSKIQLDTPSSSDNPFAKAAMRPSLLLSEVLMRIQLDYVEPQRLIPIEFLKEALVRLEQSVPEVLFALDISESVIHVRIRVNTVHHVITVSELNNLYDLHTTLQQLIAYLQSQKMLLSDIEIPLIQGMLSKLDPHSGLLSPEIFREFKISTGGQFAGVGMIIGIRNEQLVVITPIEGSPAAKAGIQINDRIIRIGTEDTSNMNLNDTIAHLRGDIGSVVTIHVMREGVDQPLIYHLNREIIQVSSVESLDLPTAPHTLRYLRIKTFQQKTHEELEQKLQNLDSIKGLILDLRNNPGGLLEEAIEVSDLFLPENKIIVSTVGSQIQSQIYRSHWPLDNQQLLKIPIIVLVNNGSASASEIVSAALKNHQRAVVIGEQTFGKGSVQSVWELPNNVALKLTIAQYLTPGNQSIQSIGVTPNILLFPARINTNDYHLIRNIPFHDLENSFSNTPQTPPQPPVAPDASFQYLSTFSEEKSDSATLQTTLSDLKQDFFVQFAAQILQQHQEDTSLIKTALQLKEQSAREQDLQITKALEEFGIDWRKPPDENWQPSSSLEIQIQTEWRPIHSESWQPLIEPVPVDAVIRFQVFAKNIGTQPFYRMIAITDSPEEIFHHLEFPLGYLPPGTSKSYSIPVSLSTELLNTIEPIEFKFISSAKYVLSQRIFPRFAASNEPRFELELQGYDNGELESEGNGDQYAQPGETIALKVLVHNIGRVPSHDTKALLKYKNIEMVIKKGRLSLGKMSPSTQEEGVLLFHIPKEAHLSDQTLLTVEISDSHFRDRTLKYEWGLQNMLPLGKYRPPEIQDILINGEDETLTQITTQETLTLTGSAEDDQKVKDVFIFVNSRKIFFQANTSPVGKQLPFSTPVHLSPGVNQIRIYGRDQHKLMVNKTLQIWREPVTSLNGNL